MNQNATFPDIFKDKTVNEISQKYKKSPAQVALKHLIQKGIIVIPKSINPQRIKENFQLHDWVLESEDVNKLNNLDLGSKGRLCDFSFFPGLEKHPEFPF